MQTIIDECNSMLRKEAAEPEENKDEKKAKDQIRYACMSRK